MRRPIWRRRYRFSSALSWVSGRYSPLTGWGAGIYFLMRAIYIPAYALGWGAIRSLIWGISMAGLMLVLISLL
ncbi:hypothetical protein NKW43_08845 [Gluconobacter albidus]|nr:hypothetical protein [Gluconobacter albidus]